ncbi:uncharacterized protein B0P05DRAFT_585606 [Gilbertella persicaria]|uniref:uncharacterized protein n=1 Tax=Gilbertella persicaria TaxID=101096 RepID=UPI00221ECC7A|nr:uncharacterized protein B0P05DRAFT_585606 [Gilbertella persicaria]KAI8084314.1 hypothetical protein B0P05DRAFT_585606 [Gilbertella persicaria]
MPLFGLKTAKKKLSSTHFPSSLTLRKTQSTGDIDDSSSATVSFQRKVVIVNHKHSDAAVVSILRTPQRPPTPPSSHHNMILAPVLEGEDEELASRLREITACDMELLLSLETQARMDVQEEKEKKQQRPSRIRFELPVTPPRSRSPDPNFHHARQRRCFRRHIKKNINRLTRWSRLVKQQQQEEAKNNQIIKLNSLDSCNSSLEELSDNNADNVVQADISTIVIGSKVKLFKRPLPLIGKVQYIGKVHWDTSSEWLGIELDGRVGNTDGKVDNTRYFQTNPHCGIFVKKEDAIKVQ